MQSKVEPLWATEKIEDLRNLNSLQLRDRLGAIGCYIVSHGVTERIRKRVSIIRRIIAEKGPCDAF